MNSPLAASLSAELRTQHTTPALVEAAARHYGDKPFIVDAERQWSFQQLLLDVRALAADLIASGFQAGDRAAIWAPNCGEWILAALATHYAGGTVVTLNTRYKGSEAAQVLRQSGASLLFVVAEFLNSDYPAMLANEDLGNVKQQILIGANNQAAAHSSIQASVARGMTLLQQDSVAAGLEARRAGVNPETVSDILFTSGTTGRAKGVITLHGQNLRTFAQFADVLGLDDSDRYLIINPFFHSFGYKAGWLAALLSGATVYPLAIFDVPTVLERIARDQITVMPGPPTLFQSILNDPGLANADLSSLVKATTGAASIPTQLIVDMFEVLGIRTVLSAYGLSESCGLVSICRQGDAPETIATTSGRAIPEIELAIMNADGQQLPAGESGEIVVRGYNVMAGYLDDPAATNETIDAHGWLHTGDIGNLDANGNLRITDRLKDMFICGGFNCYPAEIENQLLAHDDIAQVAVIGIADERMGEVGAAFIVSKPGAQLNSAELTAWSREHMANYKVPRKFIAVDSLPLNASGKVLKTELRARLAK